ncbi:MAG: PIN domain-containing protein [Pseudonocardiaceae bacterium]
MTLPVVLDAEGLDALADPSPPSAFRALLREALDRGRDVLVPAVVCAEACRGPARTRRVETALARHRPTRGQRPPVAVVDTDFVLARQVGAVLYGAGSADLADAHVVAVCVRRGGGLVITSDPDDIARLAVVVPAARVVTRPVR